MTSFYPADCLCEVNCCVISNPPESSAPAPAPISPAKLRNEHPNCIRVLRMVIKYKTEKSLPCTVAPDCAFGAPNATSLRTHMAWVHEHEGKPNFLCMECVARSLYFKNQLRSHMWTHTGENPFACLAPTCGRATRHAAVAGAPSDQSQQRAAARLRTLPRAVRDEEESEH